MESAAEANAFAKAVSYLNYMPAAKWTAQAAAFATAVIYVTLLAVLWLFADLMVHRGQLPNFHELSRREQDHMFDEWRGLTTAERTVRVEQAGVDRARAEQIASLTPDAAMDRDALDRLWRGQIVHILSQRLGSAYDFATVVEPVNYDDLDHGILSLIVRAQAADSWLTPVVSWLARWNPWMWTLTTDGHPPFSTYLVGLFAIAFVLAIVAAGMSLLMHEMAARAVIEATTRLRRAVYHHTFRLGTLAFRALGPTEAVTVFTRHVEAVHDALFVQLTLGFREPIKFVLLLLFALFVQPWLAVAFLLFAVLVWIVGGQVAAYFAAQGRLATNQAGERLTIMRESIMLMRLVKCYLMEQFNQSRVERQLSRYAQVQLLRHRGDAIHQPLLVFLGLLCSLVLLFVAGVIVLYGQLSVPSVAVMAVALVSLYWPVQHWREALRIVRRGRDAAGQLFKFLERRGEVGQVVGAEFLPPLAKQIEFDKVSLREPGTGRMLLEEVSLAIPAGKRIGLIGPDDLEKHALVYLIPRLLDPTVGEIRFDDRNLRWVTLDSLRAQIATVLQHNLVFHDTVANNIGCGDSAYTLPQIIEAAKLAHAHHFVQKLPQGYETPIGELGHSLAPSEQFRIGLARAILRDPALLIIEEPDVTLDEDTKALVDDTMTRILPGRTAIFLPHRISTIRSCDRLFLIHKGHIEASGIHKELLAQNALYRHLHYIEFNEIAEQI